MAGSLSRSNVSNLRRAVVGLRGPEINDKPRIADFFQCLVHHFSPNELSTTINCGIADDMLLLYSASNENVADKLAKTEGRLGTEYDTVTLHHSPQCPLWKLPDYETSSPLVPPKNKGINVGVTILLESSDSHVLLTQRSDKMRTFPRAWVPPGGNLEVGESPLQGALRELEEEAGLMLNSSNSVTQLLCLWESVYPPMLPFGLPTSHHVVLYFHAKSKETWEELQAKINLDPEEVKACTWLTRDNVRSICEGPTDIPQHIKQFVLGDNGEIQAAELDIHKMYYNQFWQKKHVYTGAQLVLTKWMESNTNISNISSKI